MTESRDAAPEAPEGVDIERPSAARVYDWYLGGDQNWAIDREFGKRALDLFPPVAELCRLNREFLGRAVRAAVAAGIRQFLDLGSGGTGGPLERARLRRAPRQRPTSTTGFVDLTGNQGLLGQVEGRSAGDAGAWLAARTQQWRDGISTVAIDMCAAYRATVAEHLPHARLVVDHFHVVQLANQMVSSVRRRVTATLRGRRVRKDDPEYGLRRRLLRNREDLTVEKFTDMWNRLADLGQAGDEILTAWIAKEELRTLLALARKDADRHRISHHLWVFYRWCADTDITELHRLARTIQAWWPEIEAFIFTGITNAASEGVNRLIKLEARNAFGFRNPTNQRLRSRCATTRASRRRTKPG
ncbi:MAG TPA: transposase [Amycolatopsis sp.]|uniref:transposase n=1 Tax=Amycolatopsis sp. TaxID=37632 RepID=UPI002B480D29|nr:transposase [Amycolatopsis sp.]HKS49360.1 transposase [Amycolatopsis sp.]